MFPGSSCDKLIHWHKLRQLAAAQPESVAALFATEPDRLQALTTQCGDLLLDMSRQSFSLDTWKVLCDFAEERSITKALQSWFYGDEVNASEGRAAVHQLYRHQPDSSVAFSNGCWSEARWDESAREELQRMGEYAAAIRDGRWHGSTGKRIDTIINVGIGGSHLGIEAVYQSLAPWRVPNISVLFVANIDPLACHQALQGLDLAQTALVLSSKSATTMESLHNFTAITDAFSEQGITNLQPHLFAVTSKAERMAALGIVADQIFTLPESIGGRYSLWSPIGFALECAVQPEAMAQLRLGAAGMDQHTIQTPVSSNMPIMLALASLWQHGLCGVQHHAVLAYSHALRTIVQHLQQLIMESNGKRVTIDGTPATTTGEIVWGGENSNGQHSYFQLLHQGNQPQHCDLLVAAKSVVGGQAQQNELTAMALGQARALTFGNPSRDSKKATLGNIPMSIILCRQLDPHTIGALLVLYENRTISHAVLLGINPFDQWGVEYGKQSAGELALALDGGESVSALDPSTELLVQQVHSWRGS